ncbi:MAG: hypothetical protein ACOH1O_00800 [Flavobacterium sp.]
MSIKWVTGPFNFQDIEKEATSMAKNQFDLQEMNDTMVEVIPMKEHNFRLLFALEMVEMCQEHQNREYEYKDR